MLFPKVILFSLFLFLSPLSQADEQAFEVKTHSDWSFQTMGLTPIQNGGRIKPFDSFAREALLSITGSRSYSGWNSVDLLLSWIAHPSYWEKQAFIRVGREDVRRQLGLDEKKSLFSPHELFRNPALLQYAERMGKGMEGATPPGTPRANPRDQELKQVLDRLGVFHQLVTGQGWTLIPKPLPAAWGDLLGNEREGEIIRNQFVDLLKNYQKEDKTEFERSSLLFRAAVEGEIPNYASLYKSKVAAETLYNRLRPFAIAWVFYLLAAAAWIAGPRLRKSAYASLGTALLSHTMGMGLRCFVAGRPPVTNMYESVIWVSFGVVVFALIIYAVQRQRVIVVVASILAMLGLIAGDSAPAIMDPSIQPLVPVLRSNYWLTVHVLTITLGYAAFALTMGLANITLFQFLKKKKTQQITSLNQLTYRAMQFGVVLIAAGTILGGIWADYSWGRFWGWDPKEVWALITLLCYLVILHGRYTNWVGQFGFAALSALSFMSVVMAWYGVNFILGAGLHSYGFSTGGTPWVVGFVAIQLGYILFVVFSRKVSKS